MPSFASTEDPPGPAPARPPEQTRPRYASPTVLVAGGIAAILLIVVGVLSLLASGPAPKSSLDGTRFVSFSEPSVIGANQVVAPWRTHHPAALLFFGYWCTICHDEVHALGPALGDGVLDGVHVVGIDSDASIGVARSFVAANDVRFPVAHDWLPLLTEQWVPAGDPATIFVGANGRVAAVHYGAITLAELRAGIVALHGS